ncbi:hypothetical protein JCM30471_27080 [Desulfuromonas carbonis]|uniref:hypothetical protein n=1 Tax=Desulfuromonas sp. DDH964 TaxID=1823759 RepID=UPI00078D9E6D|nr:hypothetical protein [Desulfuromonas sp. DDH964]AMV70901.1 hypothetical protein DBW_0500 [Desulfuromonas sp. DDH964]
MIQRRLLKWLPVAMLAAFLLAGCSGDNSSQGTPAGKDAVAQKATVTFKVQFPESAVQKAMIDDRTVSVQVQWGDYYNYSFIDSITLTPDSSGMATATVTVPVGMLQFTAWANDANGMELEMISTAGDIVEGNNTVYLTFLGGDWQFVDANDAPMPLSVGTGASSRTLTGFSLGSAYSHGMYAKAKVDYTKPMGYGDYRLQWFDTAGAVGSQMAAWADNQLIGGVTNNTAFGSDMLNLTTPANSDNFSFWSFATAGDRVLFVVNSGPDSGTIKDGAGNDLTGAIDAVADAQILDGTHISGHLLEMTFDSVTGIQTPTRTNIDCAPYWTYAGAARSAAIKAAFASSSQGPAKAAPGDSSTVTATLVAAYEECNQQPYQIDGDGDQDFWYGDYLTFDFNSNNRYDPADGDTYQDTNNDGNFDFMIYNQVDGDGDGDMLWDYMIVDVNHNGRYDAADGDTYQDTDSDGKFDFVYTPGDLYAITETFSNVVAREFRARGSQIISQFTPSVLGTWGPAGYQMTGQGFAVSFLDATHYIHVEDGIPDTDPITGNIIGGPGMEYGTYSVNATTGDVTFTASKDTTGDWGPAGTGTQVINFQFLDNNHFQITDPVDSTTQTLGRVTSNWNSAVGSWKFGSEALGMQVVTLFEGGNYLVASSGPPGTSNLDGMESGTYSFQTISESIDGTVTANITFNGMNSTIPDLNDTVIAAPGTSVTMPITMTNHGNTIEFDNNGTPVAFSRVQ